MEFKTVAHKLVARICAYCEDNNLPEPGQVRTTKLVYLTECGYYGWERKRLTELNWIFWHYGPWSQTLDYILKDDFRMAAEEEHEPGKFRPVHWTKPEFDKPKLKFDPTTEGVLLGVLEGFAALPYNELLDYVYFETEPMRNVVKGQELDFCVIPQAQLFVDPVSLLPPKVFHEIRKKFHELAIPEGEKTTEEGTVDRLLAEFLAVIDKESEFELPEGEVLIDDDTKSELKTILRD